MHIHSSIYICTYICTYMCVRAHTHTHTHTHIYKYLSACVCVCVCVRTGIRIVRLILWVKCSCLELFAKFNRGDSGDLKIDDSIG